MTEIIDWGSLERTIERHTTFTEKLPEGLYACPRCGATGRILLGSRPTGPHPTAMCGMCRGTRIIKRCKDCKENPIPHNDSVGLCNECAHKRMDHLLELDKRPEIICNFPQWTMNCPNPELQEQNCKKALVCGLESCQYSHPPAPLSPEKCEVIKTNPNYCKVCIHKDFCKV